MPYLNFRHGWPKIEYFKEILGLIRNNDSLEQCRNTSGIRFFVYLVSSHCSPCTCSFTQHWVLAQPCCVIGERDQRDQRDLCRQGRPPPPGYTLPCSQLSSSASRTPTCVSRTLGLRHSLSTPSWIPLCLPPTPARLVLPTVRVFPRSLGLGAQSGPGSLLHPAVLDICLQYFGDPRQPSALTVSPSQDCELL